MRLGGYKRAFPAICGAMLGRRQVVRHRFLVPAFAGSNPAAPAISSAVQSNLLGLCLLRPSGRGGSKPAAPANPQTIVLPGRVKWPKEFPRIGPLSPAQNLNMLAIELPDFAIRQLSTIRANRRSIRVFTIRKSARPCIAFDLWRVAAGVRGAHPPNTTFTGGNLPQFCPQEFESRVRRRRA